ncbi:MAG: NAD-dependent deacylase [Saprospiraceae bacterium]|nr:NAD-dependent deacylase [Saprospiraceae bacterium]
MKKIVILSGAGMSAESGISTFRDAGGLWEGHDVMTVASPEGWENNQELVLDFYNHRRRQLKEAKPNSAHYAIASLEKKYEVVVITQNVDNLHEQAGSSRIIHLHGELNKVRSSEISSLIMDWTEDLCIGDKCPQGYQLRPHIVWFGEMVPMLEPAIQECETGDIFIIIGTSMQVYPAAGLIAYARRNSSKYYIDPKPYLSYELNQIPNLEVIAEKATIGVVELVDLLMK